MLFPSSWTPDTTNAAGMFIGCKKVKTPAVEGWGFVASGVFTPQKTELSDVLIGDLGNLVQPHLDFRPKKWLGV